MPTKETSSEAQSPQVSCCGSGRRRSRRRLRRGGRNRAARRSRRLPSALPPNAHVAAAETGAPELPSSAEGMPGSDFMVDVIKTLDIKYVPANPASSYRGIHESLINYGKNTMPEFLTCMHEESGVAMCHGYFKATGKPLMTLVHGVVGLQHAAMAVYNAWCDRVPVLIVGGNDLDAAHRAPGVPTFHSGQDINAIVRDYTKWDDNPVSAAAFRAEFRAHVQDRDHAALRPGDDGARRRPADGAGARFRRAALHPEIFCRAHRRRAIWPRSARPRGFSSAPNGRSSSSTASARTPNGVSLLVELAELLQAPVVDQGNRMNFPNTHYLSRPPNVIGAGRRHHRHGAVGLLGDGQRLSSITTITASVRTFPSSSRDQADQHQLRRSSHQIELSGFSALPEHRCVDAGRRRGDAAVADRCGEVGDRRRSQGCDSQARR